MPASPRFLILLLKVIIIIFPSPLKTRCPFPRCSSPVKHLLNVMLLRRRPSPFIYYLDRHTTPSSRVSGGCHADALAHFYFQTQNLHRKALQCIIICSCFSPPVQFLLPTAETVPRKTIHSRCVLIVAQPLPRNVQQSMRFIQWQWQQVN